MSVKKSSETQFALKAERAKYSNKALKEELEEQKWKLKKNKFWKNFNGTSAFLLFAGLITLIVLYWGEWL